MLALLAGHPLAVTWAAGMLQRGSDSAQELVADWERSPLHTLDDTTTGKERTLAGWFARSMAGLRDREREVLAVAAALASTPFVQGLINASLGAEGESEASDVKRALRGLVHANVLQLASEAPTQWTFTHVLAHKFAREQAQAAMHEVRPRAARHVGSELARSLTPPVSPASLEAARVMLAHGWELLRTDANHVLWADLGNYLLYEGFDRFVELGQLAAADGCAREVGRWLGSHPDAAEPDWQRERSVSLIKVGDVQSAQGDLAGALTSYEAVRRILETLLASQPLNAQWQRDLSVTLSWIGNVRFAQGDLSGALQSYAASHGIGYQLACSDPSSAQDLRGLLISWAHLGDVQSARGDLEDALESYEASRVIAAELASMDPSNALWQRDLSVTLRKVGAVQSARGDLEDALKSFEASRVINAKLASLDRSNVGWQRDLSMSLNKLGDVQFAKGDLCGARKNYEDSLKIRAELGASNPTEALWQRDLSVSQNKIGDVQFAQGDLAGALKSYEASRVIAVKLASSDPSNVGWQRDLSMSLNKLGDAKLARFDLLGARKLYKASLQIRAKLASSNPSHAGWKGDLRQVRVRLALVWALLAVGVALHLLLGWALVALIESQ
jgi:tetratricopeptide (TPR) repeat protein